MASFWSVFNGFMIMVLSILIGLMLAFGGGIAIDYMHTTFTTAGLYDVPQLWDTSATTATLINLYYFMVYAIPILGVGVFLFTVARKEQYDAYTTLED